MNPEKLVDNVKFYKIAAIKDLKLQRGFHLEYFPPYSPFLNPIENMFSKCKEFTKPHCCNNELIAIIMNGKNSVMVSDAKIHLKMRKP